MANHSDLLKEIGSIGIGHAATRLATLVNTRVDVPKVPTVKSVPLAEVADFLGGPESLVYGFFFKITGALAGSLFIILHEESVLQLLHCWLGHKSSRANMPLDAEDESALKEFCNIAIGGYLTAIGDLTNETLLCSIPAFANDMLGALLNEVLITTAKLADVAVLIDTIFVIDKYKIKGDFLLVLEQQSLEKLVTILEQGLQ